MHEHSQAYRVFRIFLHKVMVVFVATLALPAIAGTAHASDRFCIQPIELDSSLGKPSYWSLEHVVETAEPEQDVIFFRGITPVRLIQDRLVPVADEFPTRHDHNSIITTPDDDVIGIGGYLGARTFYGLNRESGRFERVEIDSIRDLKRTRDIVWSTPVDAPLLTIGGSAERPDHGAVLVLKGNRAAPLGGLDHWVTHVTDFPELNLTVLVTEVTDQVFVIDGNQELHELAALNLGEWRYVSRSLFLKNPPRLLLEASEAYGAFRGLFLIQLENTHGVWTPQKHQDWTNLMDGIPARGQEPLRNGRRVYDPINARYFFHGQFHGRVGDFFRRLLKSPDPGKVGLYQVGETRLERVDETDPELFQSLPPHIKIAVDESYLSKLFGDEKKMEMPASNSFVMLSDDAIRVVDSEGQSHILDRSLLGSDRFRPHGQAWYLPGRGEILISSNDALALLKDSKIAGKDACS
ncbi:MAG: hypothetical protein AAFO72_06525 [Pseudomonadota bacterium]